MDKFDAVLFDLDGTLIDSGPDLVNTLNDMLTDYQRKPKLYKELRDLVSYGSARLLEVGFQNNYPKDFQLLRDEFLARYDAQSTKKTKYFDGIESLLDQLDKKKIPWAIVTNKPTKSTIKVAKKFAFDQRAKAIVCGDTLPVAKPDPSPILLACKMMGVTPENCVYLGDCDRDIIAGQAAHMHTIACAYGYVTSAEQVKSWQADYIANTPSEISNFL